MPLDYSGQNLRGRSFKGQNLTGANFSKADIRGANFTNAILKGANFSGATAGLQPHVAIYLLVGSWIISILTGFFSTTAGISSLMIVTTDVKTVTFLSPAIFLTISIVFLITLLSKGATPKHKNKVINSIAVFTSVIGALIGATAGLFSIIKLDATIISFVLTVIIMTVLSQALAAGVSLTRFVPGAIVKDKDLYGELVLILTIIGSGVGALIIEGWQSVPVVVLIAGAVALVGNHCGQGALAEDPTWVFTRRVGIAIAAIGGTNFHDAKLIDANFTDAILKNTNFSKADLTRTRFYKATKLDFAKVDDTILANRAVLELLVTLNGRNKSYAGANLRGANLIGADLKEANLKDANISEATFQGAKLEWANLTLAQAVGTNFTNAQMTGACVEAWNIKSTTILDNVDCLFVYLLEYPKPRIDGKKTDDRERRPSHGEFKPGEFTKLFEEVLNTVDLIFQNGIDWKAFVAAFKKVQVENGDTELTIQSIENKGDGVVVVKVAVPDNTDKEKIHSDFTQNYQLALAAVEEKYKAELQAKNNEIVIYRQQSAEMTEIVKLLANKPINVQVDNKVENKNMTNDSSRKVEIGSIGGDFNASGQALNLGEISGTVTNTINELPSGPEPDKPGIKELLTQLKTAIEADTDLKPKDKEKALKQVKALAEAAQNPQEKQDLADTAITMLKGTIAHLPTAAKLVEECGKLLPIISGFLGLG